MTGYNLWELRLFVILSMSLQIFLIIWTYRRKRTAMQPIRRILWLVSFLASDFLPPICLGIIFHKNMDTRSSDKPQNKYLLAMWAPFMLLYLGRHSKITIFSLDENEFWLGRLLKFVYFELIAFLTCVLAARESELHLVSSLLFITGTVKFVERVLALKNGSLKQLGSFNNFTNEVGEGGDDPINTPTTQNRRGDIENPIDDVPQVDVEWTITDVYQAFSKSIGMYTDIIFTSKARNVQDKVANMVSINNAFNFMETELSFAYDMFYTTSVCSDSVWGWIARWICFFFISYALWAFAIIAKQKFLKADVIITYSLLIVALTLELVCLLESWVSNRWIRRVVTERAARGHHISILSMGQFNLLQFCFNDKDMRSWQKWVLKFFELKDLWDNCCYISYTEVDFGEFMDSIINRVRARLQEEDADDFYTFPISSTIAISQMALDNPTFEANKETGFERCLLVWHLATDLRYRAKGEQCPNELQHAKLLSQYMMYLLVLHPTLLSPLTTTELTAYQDICAELTEFYAQPGVGGLKINGDLERMYELINQGVRDSLFMNSIQLARDLMENEGNDTWEELFKLWVDMLSYVACRSRGKEHAQLLGRGDELITYVRLFMVHSFG